MTKNTTTASARRKIAAVGAVAGALALSLGSAPSAHAAPAGVPVTCVMTSPVAQTLHWTAEVTTTAPTTVEAGSSLPSPTVTATVTTDTKSADLLRLLGVSSLSGTSNAPYNVSGAVVNPGDRDATLNVPTTQVPATGGITTVATGTGQAETAADTPGTITVTALPFTVDLLTDTGSNIKGSCTFDNGNPVIATTTVTPKVDTGIAAGDSGNLVTQAGIGIAAVGALAAGGAVAVGRRRKSSN